ncbi:MAG: hypothetical protein EPN25_11515 [Nitrospirae bacterium]|nr:MAG: hypothetical protein EPN25_11515 [Nitrospirota bacterium]
MQLLIAPIVQDVFYSKNIEYDIIMHATGKRPAGDSMLLDGGNMKKILFCTIILIIHSICYARDPVTGNGTLIAIELKANDKLTAVGSLEYTGETLEIVSFSKGVAGIGIVPVPQIYNIVDKTIRSQGIHHIKGQNQNGVIASGTIDFRNQIKPKITLITDGGTVITNISMEGLKWKKKYIPDIILGQE